jgi:hypothetical protein
MYADEEFCKATSSLAVGSQCWRVLGISIATTDEGHAPRAESAIVGLDT